MQLLSMLVHTHTTGSKEQMEDEQKLLESSESEEGERV